MRTALLLAGFVGALGLACVSHVPVEGAPCPCPEPGMTCCPTLLTCVSSMESCPAMHSSSSRQSCRSDGECPKGELCESWAVEGTPAGPGQCRRDCSDGFACAQGEVCDPAPHDGRPLEDLQVARLCVSAIPDPGCEGQGCHECPVGTLGSTYCEGHSVRGCFLATHPKCGLTCRPVSVSECGLRRCLVQEGVAQCDKENLVGPVSPCLRLDCAPCGDKAGSVFCDGGSLTVCVALPSAKISCEGPEPCTCPQICAREVVQSCASCSTNDGLSTCLP